MASEGQPPSKRYALLYPFQPGKAAEAEELFKGGGDPPPQAGMATKLVSTTVFRKDDTVVRVFEIIGDLGEAIEHMARATELSDLGTKLKGLLDDSVDLTTTEGIHAFFRDQLMDVIIDRSGPPPGVGGPPGGGPPGG